MNMSKEYTDLLNIIFKESLISQCQYEPNCIQITVELNSDISTDALQPM